LHYLRQILLILYFCFKILLTVAEEEARSERCGGREDRYEKARETLVRILSSI